VRCAVSADCLGISNLYFCCTSRQQRLLNITRPLHSITETNIRRISRDGIDNERGADPDNFLLDVYYCVSPGSVSDVSGQFSVSHDRTGYSRIHSVFERRFQRPFLWCSGMVDVCWNK